MLSGRQVGLIVAADLNGVVILPAAAAQLGRYGRQRRFGSRQSANTHIGLETTAPGPLDDLTASFVRQVPALTIPQHWIAIGPSLMPSQDLWITDQGSREHDLLAARTAANLNPLQETCLRTPLAGALALMLVGCSSQPASRDADVPSCTSPNPLACMMAVRVPIEPASVKASSTHHESKSTAACAGDQVAPREPRHAPRPAKATSKIIATAACARNPPDPALLAPLPAPDCELKRSDLDTLDRDEWVRLKAEYERQCFKSAEKAARNRLALLQASSTCAESVRQPRLTRQQ